MNQPLEASRKMPYGSLDPRPDPVKGPPNKPWRVARYVIEDQRRWVEFLLSGERVCEGEVGASHPDFTEKE